MTEFEVQEIVKSCISQLGSYSIRLSDANRLINAVMSEAERIGVRAVVAVCNAQTNPISVQSADDAYIASYDIALNKSFTATSLKMPTKKLGSLAQPGASLYGIQFTNGGKIVIFGGGEMLCDKSGNIVGGLGVSGGSEEQDTYLGEYGKKFFENNIMKG